MDKDGVELNEKSTLKLRLTAFGLLLSGGILAGGILAGGVIAEHKNLPERVTKIESEITVKLRTQCIALDAIQKRTVPEKERAKLECEK